MAKGLRTHELYDAGLPVSDLVFLGFNKRVVAVDRETGATVWEWTAPQGMGFVTVLLDGDRLLAGVSGYIFCLDPATGRVLWENLLKGRGVGAMTITTARGTTGPQPLAAAEQQQQAAAAAAG